MLLVCGYGYGLSPYPRLDPAVNYLLQENLDWKRFHDITTLHFMKDIRAFV
jgi:hypothetical protein